MVSVRRLLSHRRGSQAHAHGAAAGEGPRRTRRQCAPKSWCRAHVFEEVAGDLVDRARRVAGCPGSASRHGLARRGILAADWRSHADAHDRQHGRIGHRLEGRHQYACRRGSGPRRRVLYAGQLLAAREGRRTAAHVEITDMTAHSLGIAWREFGQRQRKRRAHSARHRTALRHFVQVYTQIDDQTSLDVELVEGESRDADECRRSRRISISGLPPELPKNSPVELHYQITAEGRMQVKARLLKTGQTLAIDVARRAGGCRRRKWPIGTVAAKQSGTEGHPRPRPGTPQQYARRPPNRLGPRLPPVSCPSTWGGRFPTRIDRGQSAGHLRENASSGRNLLIMLVGHVVFALLGLTIGYFIFMYLGMLPSEWNVFHWRLPGCSAGDSARVTPPWSLAGRSIELRLPDTCEPLV